MNVFFDDVGYYGVGCYCVGVILFFDNLLLFSDLVYFFVSCELDNYYDKGSYNFGLYYLIFFGYWLLSMVVSQGVYY